MDNEFDKLKNLLFPLDLKNLEVVNLKHNLVVLLLGGVARYSYLINLLQSCPVQIARTQCGDQHQYSNIRKGYEYHHPHV